jgi:hypothetical protein
LCGTRFSRGLRPGVSHIPRIPRCGVEEVEIIQGKLAFKGGTFSLEGGEENGELMSLMTGNRIHPAGRLVLRVGDAPCRALFLLLLLLSLLPYIGKSSM